MKERSIREPAVAGAFYPADPDTLQKEITRYLNQAAPGVSPDHVFGLISPHAGYPYSGGAAAHGYKLLMGKKYKRVVVFALSHRVSFRGASIFEGSGYATPLGVVKIDEELVRKIRTASTIITFSPMAHQVEHSLEVQIPFLQTVLDDFLLVPILIRDQDLSTCQEVVKAILGVLPRDAGKETLVVGSTDLYHGPDYQECKRRDQELASIIEEYDEKKLEEKINRGLIMACGPASVMATMLLCRELGATKIERLQLTNSADVTGQMSDYVVGYLSAVLY